MTDDNDDLKKQLEAHKPKKKKLTVPEGFLEEAKSYEGKLMAVKILVEREKSRVLLMFKKLLEPELPPPKRIEPTLEPLKPKTPPKKKFLGKK
jgi:hypothetical protein